MTQRSPFDFDVSVSAAKRARARGRGRGMSGAVEHSTRQCDWPGCTACGQYRAPVSPERLNEYHWFCLEHVRQYNRSWNYFAEFSDEEFDAWTRDANAWERPTWDFRGGTRQAQHQPHAEGRAWARSGFSDPMEVLGASATLNPAETGPKRRRLSRTEQIALDILGVPHQEESRAVVRRAYRALVKDLHPDMNGGENADPERLTRVLKAWETLKNSPHFSD